MRDRFIGIVTALSKPAVALGGAVVIGGAILAYAYLSTNVSPGGTYTAAVVGPVTEEVDVTGTVKAAHATDLAFQVSGRVAAVHAKVGDHVYAGQTLAALDGASASAALAGADASLETQEAKLAALEAGTRPEQLAINETAKAQAELALKNAIQSAYVYADDAVRVKADQAFTNPRTTGAKLSPQVPDATLVARTETERVALEPILSSWQGSLASSTPDLSASAALAESHLETIGAFLDDLSTALSKTVAGGSTSAAVLASYQAAVNAARLSVTTALSSVTSADTAYKAAQGALALAQAGATPQDIAAQRALVDSARAAVASARAALGNTVIVAPVSGTVTVQDAELGETVIPGSPLTSMIADGKFQADAQVSEADIAKVAQGDSVIATFDAYPGVAFPATVTTVPPAAQVAGGVPSYLVTATFSDNDARLRAGLSANLRIVTATKENVLSVPGSAVITSGDQKFVYVKSAGGPVKTPVSTGIESGSGQTEITGGLAQGDEVLTFGSSVTR
jgi:RND family efflux transporter MFP subunit